MRFKNLYMHPRRILGLFQRDVTDCISSVKLAEPIPEGASVINVAFAPERGAFVFLIEHESFDLVSPNEIPPCIEDYAVTEVITVEDLRDEIIKLKKEVNDQYDAGWEECADPERHKYKPPYPELVTEEWQLALLKEQQC